MPSQRHPENARGTPSLPRGFQAVNDDANNGRTLYLVVGSAYIFRAYHALPPLTRADGMPVGAVRGFMTMMLRLVEDHARDYFAVIFDASGETFRSEIYDQYKANRDAPPEDLKPQFSSARQPALRRDLGSNPGALDIRSD